ncbi:MAG: hypothetical protein IKC75_02360 [Clostridia bacterium]|nr:hypothetical protein [Clostridia bacterium]
MTYVFMVAIVLLYTAQSFLTRLYSARYPGNADNASPVFSIISGITVAVVSVAVCGFHFAASPLTWLLGILNALALILYNATIIKASQTGPYSVLMVFSIAGGIIIPALVGAIAFGDDLTPLKIVCILVVLVCVYLISDKDQKTKTRRGFWAAVFALAIGNGLYGSLLDVQQRVTSVGEKEEMIAITFAVCALISLCMLAFKLKGRTVLALKQTKMSAFYLVATSLVAAGAVHVLTFVIGLIDLAILYTFYCSGVLMLSVLFSALFFGERLSVKNIIGCVVMSVALVFMMGGDTLLLALQ